MEESKQTKEWKYQFPIEQRTDGERKETRHNFLTRIVTNNKSTLIDHKFH